MQQGTPIATTSPEMAILEAYLADHDDAVAVSTFVGQGATRFLLTYESEPPNPAYGRLIIRTENLELIPALMADLEAFAAQNLPEGEFRTERLVFGPGGGSPIEVRLSGRDPEVLRNLADQAIALMTATSANILTPRIDWREQELVLRPLYVTERGQAAGITRDDVAQAILLATDGVTAGTRPRRRSRHSYRRADVARL